jgi:hypothetical protein
VGVLHPLALHDLDEAKPTFDNDEADLSEIPDRNQGVIHLLD